ncbi:monovalent cation/H+ antiporter complex subunit F [Candidatus Binatia bacterium]|nr:monovalent cation/H+ antiporter complex subunit F [Candidatus Binatia bacterium]
MLDLAIDVSLVGLALSLALCAIRLVRGPHAVDRVLALDTMTVNVVALLLVLSVAWRTEVFLESILALAVLAFVSTVAIAKYLMRGRVIE